MRHVYHGPRGSVGSTGPFVTFASAPTNPAIDLSQVQIEIGIAADFALTNAGTATWGSVNVVGP